MSNRVKNIAIFFNEDIVEKKVGQIFDLVSEIRKYREYSDFDE